MSKKETEKQETTEKEFVPEDFKENKELATFSMDEDNRFIADLKSTRQTMFCSLQPKTLADKKILFKASNNPDKHVKEMVNEIISIKDIFCEVVNCVNRDTGESVECPRIVLIDDKGIGYQAVSMGVYGAVKKLIAVFGAPTWNEPIKVKVKQIDKGGNRVILTLDVQ